MSEKLFLSDLLVDKKHIPSPEELSLLLAKINFSEKLKNTAIIESTDLTLIFDTLENSRLFLAKLGAPISSSFFESVPITDMYFEVFTASETYHASGIEVKLINLKGDGLSHIKKVVQNILPELADKLKRFT